MPREEVIAWVQALWGAGRRDRGCVPLESFGLDARTLAITTFALALTLTPWAHARQDVEGLREAGLTDREIHDVTHVVACFNYMNRLADGLGVSVDTARKAWAIELLGEASYHDHLAWAQRT